MVAVGPIWQNRQERDELRKEFISLQAEIQGIKRVHKLLLGRKYLLVVLIG